MMAACHCPGAWRCSGPGGISSSRRSGARCARAAAGLRSAERHGRCDRDRIREAARPGYIRTPELPVSRRHSCASSLTEKFKPISADRARRSRFAPSVVGRPQLHASLRARPQSADRRKRRARFDDAVKALTIPALDQAQLPLLAVELRDQQAHCPWARSAAMASELKSEAAADIISLENFMVIVPSKAMSGPVRPGIFLSCDHSNPL